MLLCEFLEFWRWAYWQISEKLILCAVIGFILTGVEVDLFSEYCLHAGSGERVEKNDDIIARELVIRRQT